VTASAVLRVGSHAPILLHGSPVAGRDCLHGEMVIHLRSRGEDITLTITSVEWADDLRDAAIEVAACGIVRGGMARTIPAVTA